MSTTKKIRDRWRQLADKYSGEELLTEFERIELIDLANKIEEWGNRTLLRDNIRALGLLKQWELWGSKHYLEFTADSEFLSLARRTYSYLYGRS